METETRNTTVWEIVSGFERYVYQLIANRTIVDTEQYHQALQKLVWEMTCLPSNREEAGLDPATDPEETRIGLSELMDIIMTAFGCSKQQIEDDIRPFLRKYTPEDIREIRRLKRENLLH